MRIHHTLFIILISLSLLNTSYASSTLLTHVFDSNKYHYSIHYPTMWAPHDHNNGVVVFKNNSKLSTSMVNIQTIYTKQAGGHYATVKDLMDDFTTQVPKHTDHTHFFNRSPITLKQPNGNNIIGESISLTFYENGKQFKHWQVMLMSRDKQVFQAWAYRAAIDSFDSDYPVAADMLATWVIN